MDGLIGMGSAFRRDPWLGYGLAGAIFGVALLLRLELHEILPPG